MCIAKSGAADTQKYKLQGCFILPHHSKALGPIKSGIHESENPEYDN